MNTIIIDDDPSSHEILMALLEEVPNEIKINGTAFGCEEGINLIRKVQPELVFLDVELGDGTGFQVLENFDSIDFEVIFITAYNKYAKSALRFGALDFLEKPILKQDLWDALKRANQKQFERQRQIQIAKEAFIKASKKVLPTRLTISTQKEIIFIMVKKIIRMEASQSYTIIYVDDPQQQSVVSTVNLGQYIEQFEIYWEFFKTHRSHLINLHYVEKLDRGNRMIKMINGSEVPIARITFNDFLGRMEKL